MGEERLIKDPWTTGGNGPVMPDPGHEILRDKSRSQNLTNGKTSPIYDTVTLNVHQYGKAPEPCKIKLIKMAKSYGWEISMNGDDFDEILKKIVPIDEVLKAKYGVAEA